MSLMNSTAVTSENIVALYRKELKAYFNSPIAYVVMTVFLLMAGWFFTNDLFLVGQATLRTFFEVSRLIFVFFVPAITMRLLAEEKSSGSLELLVTYPVTDIEIVLSKWLASMTLLLITLGVLVVDNLAAGRLRANRDLRPQLRRELSDFGHGL